MPLCLNVGTNLSTALQAPEIPFLNVMKSGSAWFVGGGSGDASKIQVDANGYPTSMVLTDTTTATKFALAIGNFVTAPGQTFPYPAGRYVLLFSGGGTCALAGDATFVSGTAGRKLYDVTPSQFIEANITATPITDMAVIYSPDSTASVVGVNEQAYLNGTVTNPLWKALFGTAKVFRFMDPAAVISSPTQVWADRTPVGNYTYQHFVSDGSSQSDTYAIGIPIETMCSICNECNADLYVCMPWLADDTYITNFATTVLSRLSLNHKVYVEYGNEAWNVPNQSLQGPVKGLMNAAGLALYPNSGGGENSGGCWRYTRMINTADLWTTVWTGANASRLTRIGGGQNGFNIGQNDLIQQNTVSTVTINIATSTFTLSNWQGLNLPAGAQVRFSTTGALPTGMAVNTQYTVTSPGLVNTFQLSGITLSGTQSGVHTVVAGNIMLAGAYGATQATLGAKAWNGQSLSHWDAFAVAPYFFFAPPPAWINDADPLAKFFSAIQDGVSMPATTGPTVAPNDIAGTPTVLTLTSDADWGNGVVPASPANATLVRFNLQVAQQGGQTVTLRVDGGTTYPFVFLDGRPLSNSAAVTLQRGISTQWIACFTNQFPATSVAVTGATQSTAGTVDISNASPAVVAWAGIPGNVGNGTTLYFSAPLPTGISAGVAYIVQNLSGSTFNVVTYGSDALINTSTSSTGTVVFKPCEITIASPAYLLHSMSVTFSGVGGMTQLNGNTYTIVWDNITSNKTLALDGVNSSAFGAYTSGGTLTSTGAFPSSWMAVPNVGYPGGAIKGVMDQFASNYATAHTQNGLRLICYEGGQQFGSGGRVVEFQMELMAQRDARMKTAYTRLFTDIAAINQNDTVIHYADVATNNAFGYFGLLESSMQTTAPKYEAWLDAVACPFPAVLVGQAAL